MLKKINHYNLIILLAIVLNTVILNEAFPGSGGSEETPVCETVTVNESGVLGEECAECPSNEYIDLEDVGPLTIEFCGKVTSACVANTSDLIDITGSYPDQYIRNRIFDPPQIDEPGEHDVTITFEIPTCIDSDLNCAEVLNYVTVSATVKVTMVRDICGPCIPDLAEWTCNSIPSPYTLEFNKNSSTGQMVFRNQHLFDFTDAGVSQGKDLYGSEKIYSRYRLEIYGANQDVITDWYYYGGGTTYHDEPYEYSSGQNIVCTSTCTGVERSIITDIYQAFYNGISKDNFKNIYCAENNDDFTVKYVHEFNNQRVFASGEQVGGPFNSSVVMMFDVSVTEPSPPSDPCNPANLTVTYSNFTYAKTGQI